MSIQSGRSPGLRHSPVHLPRYETQWFLNRPADHSAVDYRCGGSVGLAWSSPTSRLTQVVKDPVHPNQNCGVIISCEIAKSNGCRVILGNCPHIPGAPLCCQSPTRTQTPRMYQDTFCTLPSRCMYLS